MQFEMRNDQLCKVVCRKEKFSPEALKNFKAKIDGEYRINMILDNLPVAEVRIRHDNGQKVKIYERGFAVGFKENFAQVCNLIVSLLMDVFHFFRSYLC